MKITDYKTYAVFAGFRNLIFVKVYTDEGIHGVGEATLEWKTNAALGAFEDLRPYVIGADPRRFEGHFYECFRQSYWRTDPCTLSAIAALEMAMVDITGKYYNTPAYQFFGGKFHDKLKTYMNSWSGMAKEPDDFARNAKTAVENGATALKWDFFGKSYLNISNEALNRAVRVMAAVREAVGPEIDLIVEAHGRFNTRSAITVANALAPFNPFFIEEPVLTDNPMDTAIVHESSPVPIAAGERFFGKAVFRGLIACNGVDYVQPDLIHVGGMTEFKKISTLAETFNIQLAPHNPNGPVAVAATVHMCSTAPNFETLEMLTDSSFLSDIITGGIELKNGYALVPDIPGLGIDINEEACGKYPPRETPQLMFSGIF